MRRANLFLAACGLAAASLVVFAAYGDYDWTTISSLILSISGIENAEENVYINYTADMKLSTDQIIKMLKTRLKLPAEQEHNFTVRTFCKPGSTSKSACPKPNCSELSPNPEERVRSLISNKTVLSQDQEQLLNSIAAQIPVNDVILLTATSNNHFHETAALLRNLHTQIFPEMGRQYNFSLVVWDLGLNAKERIQLEQCCRCQVVSFPFHLFPGVERDLFCYMWKPLTVRMTMSRARKFVIWNDASTRYNRYPGLIFERGMKYGIQIMGPKIDLPMPFRTLDETFYHFGQNPCSFMTYPGIWSGWGFYKSDPFVLNALATPWARCGLEKSCMCPKPSRLVISCNNRLCHRFDQSALGIITATLYGSDLWRIIILMDSEQSKDISFHREHTDPNYFKSLGCLKPN